MMYLNDVVVLFNIGDIVFGVFRLVYEVISIDNYFIVGLNVS